ncbi:MAG: biotin/lipoyl-binding protein [Prevotellaceae bacterium]|jgi:biotin carboxyl carrier protein|nr:biotin/lipoyl-binding protein [Prevotellaceae bacterium]
MSNSKDCEKNMQSLVIDDKTYETLYTKKFCNRKPWIAPDEQEVKTFIPGTVVTLNVSECSIVKQGDVLMTYEAMKMNNLVKAPHGGKVQNLSVKDGDKLAKGVVMLKIVP